MSKLTRAQIIPGVILKVKHGKTLLLDGWEFWRSRNLLQGEFTVLTKPRKIERINLVRIKLNHEEFECYYCDILTKCEIAQCLEKL